MASPVTDIEAGLQAMLNLKPPGVSGSRITSLTQLCLTNIEVSNKRTTRPLLNSTDHLNLVRVRPHPENLHPLQEGTRHPQARSYLRRRLCNPQMVGASQAQGADRKQLGP